jgi:CheY-like chemotaxis protein
VAEKAFSYRAKVQQKPPAAKRMNNTTNELTVLLVDDEEMVRLAMSTALSHAGFIVLESAQANDALDLYERHAGRIDLIVLDLVMPEMWGDEMLPKLREINPDVRVVVCSGFDIKEGEFEGVEAIIKKPVRAEKLVRIIRDALGV